jgi:hypothetical protein
MPGWDEASVDDLLADPIVRDLMAADGVDPGELRALLYGVQCTLERYATKQGRSTSLAGFVERYSTIPSTDAARPMLPAKAGRSEIRKSAMALADYSTSSTAPLGCTLAGEARCSARS